MAVPQLTFTARLTAYSPATFTEEVQEQYIQALQKASPVPVLVTITDIRAGSVVVDTVMQFLTTSGSNSESITTLASTLATNPAAILPASTWGTATVTGVTQSEATVTVPEELLAQPEKASSNKGALIGGLVGGLGGAVLIAGVALFGWRRLRHRYSCAPALQEPLSDANL